MPDADEIERVHAVLQAGLPGAVFTIDARPTGMLHITWMRRGPEPAITETEQIRAALVDARAARLIKAESEKSAGLLRRSAPVPIPSGVRLHPDAAAGDNIVPADTLHKCRD